MSLTKIIDNLYLGSYNDIIKEYFKDIGANVIINVAYECSYECKNMFNCNDEIKYYYYPYHDRPQTMINEVFDEIADLIHKNIEQKKTVFIHCYAGKSRSASFILAYLMKYKNYDLDTAYNYVNDLREIYPNLGFLKQLMDYEIKLTGQSTLDFDKYCIKYIYITVGFASIEEVNTTYNLCNNDVDLTLDKLFDR